MDSGEENRIPRCHVVAMPYPGRGHVNPMMSFCKRLVSKGNILITFVVTEEWLGFIGSAARPANIELRSIPNVIPSELVRAVDFPGFIEAVYTKLESPIEQLLDRLDFPVTAIVADTYMPCAVRIGNRRNIPVASLWTMSPSVFSVLHYFDLLVQNRHFPADLSERGGERVDYIPGISSMCLNDFPTFFSGTGRQALGRALEALTLVLKAQCLLFTSFYELDPKVIDSLRATLSFPVYPIGPTIPFFTLDDIPSNVLTNQNDINYFKWLDLQPKSSVLYVSLGSYLSISSVQMDEIAAGLKTSRIRYLWVGRGDATRLQEACGEMGLVVPWCDQLKVLCHPSIGGFWTHCGWNSTLEAIFAGVPMLTFPIFYDQLPNSKFIVEDLKVGLRVKDVGSKETVIKREDIVRIVENFMKLDGDESLEMRRRAKEFKEICGRALEKRGSSDGNLDNFVQKFLHYQGQ